LDRMLEMSIRAEARRYCDRHEIQDHDSFQRIEHALRFDAFRREIEPFIHQKCRIDSLRMLDYIVMKSDGSLGEAVYKPLPPALEEALQLWDEKIILSAQRWGVDSSPVRRGESR
jgi:hypothetical protein